MSAAVPEVGGRETAVRRRVYNSPTQIAPLGGRWRWHVPFFMVVLTVLPLVTTRLRNILDRTGRNGRACSSCTLPSCPPPFCPCSRKNTRGHYCTILASYSLKRRPYGITARQVLTPQTLTDGFASACIILRHHHAVAMRRVRILLSCACVHTACPSRARILQGRGAPGQASGQGTSSCPAPSATTPRAKARLTPAKVGLPTLNSVGAIERSALCSTLY